jgi:hypothetical protein
MPCSIGEKHMAKLTAEIRVPIRHEGEIVPITIRRPSNEEMNVYLGRKTEYTQGKDKKLRTCEPEARHELFDKLVVKVENLEDEAGQVTAETLDRIPANWKNLIIEHYVDTVLIDLKN